MAVVYDIPHAAHSQRLQALAAGNAVRTKRAGLQRMVRSGEVSIYDLLEDPPLIVGSLPVVKLLQWTPGIGHVKARLILRSARIEDHNVKMRNLGQGRRIEIVDRMHSGLSHGFTGLPEL